LFIFSLKKSNFLVQGGKNRHGKHRPYLSFWGLALVHAPFCQPWVSLLGVNKNKYKKGLESNPEENKPLSKKAKKKQQTHKQTF